MISQNFLRFKNFNSIETLKLFVHNFILKCSKGDSINSVRCEKIEVMI